ncbi:MAG: anhydro-N-acetylmuramic acid kinase [Burkholderiales bacterium]
MPDTFIGLMSGTSLDGIDAVIARFNAGSGTSELVHSHYQPFQPLLRDALLALNEPGHDELHRAALSANQLAHAYAAAIRTLLAQAGLAARDITAIGCHGQTVRHRPDAGYTTQLVNAALLAELTGITTICDFRSRDIAAGGQGAPLVPAFHLHAFGSATEHRAVVNIGGIANITDLPPGSVAAGFDCGPGNALMDEWISANLGRAYDDNGTWAASGVVIPKLLNLLLSHEFFARQPPKSTGRDTFNLAWVRRALSGDEAAADVQSTLLALTAAGIAQGIEKNCAGAQSIFVCGGGAHNSALMARLATLLRGKRVSNTSAIGVDADWVEALAFAWLARQTLLRKPGNVPGVTGAQGFRVLGAIYPA